ncbi:diguanylate cyclase [Agaribacter flavus]|uniref:diguanylate cyclase n=1 Tax=Agaribacter flavus TaxID=1902781 RepID=A0ABV7FUZ8_9ALTE
MLKVVISLWGNARKSRQKMPFIEFDKSITEIANLMTPYAVFVLHHQLNDIKRLLKGALDENISLKDAVKNIDIALNVLIQGSKTTPDPVLSEIDKGEHTAIIETLCKQAITSKKVISGGARMAVIDADPSAACATLQILQQFNYTADSFESIEAFKQQFSDDKYSLVILDIVNCGYSVEEITVFVEALNKYGVEVIACSTVFNLETRLSAVRAGVSDFIVKPLHSYSLFEKISRVLQLQREYSYTIVLVDDQESMGVFYKSVFEQANCRVEYIQSAQALFESLERLKPDLFLLDMFMPDVNGLEIASMLRQSEKFDFAPIVFLTADDTLETKLKVLDSGADDVITKSTPTPLVVKQVLARLNRSSVIRSFVSKDALTGVYNHGQIVESANDALRLSKLNKTKTAIALIDVDHFKVVNDSYGHSNGDQVLRTLGQQMRRAFRESDYIGRYGGEEFLLVLQDCDLSNGVKKLDELRQAFSKIQFKHDQGYFNVTFSAGLVCLGEYEQLRDAINDADVLLYAAKNQGRNQIKYDRDTAMC